MKLLPKSRRKFEALGSVFEIDLIGCSQKKAEDLLDLYQIELDDFEKKFSRFRVDSELGILNRSVGKRVFVSPQMVELLKLSLDLYKFTDSYFDIGVEQVLSSSGYGIKKTQRPEVTLEILMENDNAVKINKYLDFGGLGKGLMLDKAKVIFKGCDGVCVNAGGDFYLCGYDERGESWKVYWENPFNDREVIGEFENKGEEIFLAASNGLKRKWKGFHHMINPRTQGVASEMAGVFVQGKQGYWTDAVSTALFAMGYDKAKVWLEKNEVAAMIVSPIGKIFRSGIFRGSLF